MPKSKRLSAGRRRSTSTLFAWILSAVLGLVAVVVLVGAIAAGAAAWREAGARTALAPATGRFVRALDVDLFIQEMGPESGRIVVLMHGTGAWSEIWRVTMMRLAGAGYRAVAVDMPPFGFSERPSSGDYTTATQGQRLASLLDTLGGDSVTLVGHSFGARATVEAAMLASAQLATLVLVDAALGLHDSNGTPLSTARDAGGLLSAALAIEYVRRPLVASTLTNPLLSRTLLRQLISRKEAATPAIVEMLQRPLTLSGSTIALGEWLQWFVNPDRPALSGTLSSYATFQTPTLIIWGETDTVTPLPQGRALAALLPNATLHVLNATGHIPAVESPNAFNDALLEFLAAHR